MDRDHELTSWYGLYGSWLLGKQYECYERDRSALRAGEPLEDFYKPEIYRLANEHIHGRPLKVDENFAEFLDETGRSSEWRDFQEKNGLVDQIELEATRA